jgi:hypothetical protein
MSANVEGRACVNTGVFEESSRKIQARTRICDDGAKHFSAETASAWHSSIRHRD